jgi:hypothetical protein
MESLEKFEENQKLQEKEEVKPMTDIVEGNTFTEKEYDAYKKGCELIASPEYAKGEKKLHFEYTFSTGEVLTATENQEGEAQIVIRKNGETVLDFSEIVPGIKYHFYTPTYCLTRGISFTPDWSQVLSFSILIGDMRDPKSIALLLHEIGHSLEKVKTDHSDKTDLAKLWEKHAGPLTKKYKDARRKLAEEISNDERSAWALGLNLARRLKKEKGIDLLEGFDDLEDLNSVIYTGLLSYRMGIGKEMISSDEGIVKDVYEEIKQKLGLGDTTYGREQWQFLRDKFDKGRLKR